MAQRLKPAPRRCASGSAAPLTTAGGKPLFFRCRPRREPEIEVARLERILVVAQRSVVRGQRDREAGRQAAIEQAGALELIETGQIADRLQTEMRQECLGGAEGERTARRLLCRGETAQCR